MRQHAPTTLRTRTSALFGLCLGLTLAMGSGCGANEEASTFSVFVSCAPADLFGDGSNSSTCSVQVLDQNNQPAGSGTRVVFVSTVLSTTTPSGGFGTDTTPTVERFLDDAGSATVSFRCTSVGTIVILAASPAGERGTSQVVCTQISGDWVVALVSPTKAGIHPGDSTEVCAWAEDAEGGPVTPGTRIRFTHDADNGGFGGSFSDSRTAATDGLGRACVTYVAQTGNYREDVTITANFENQSFGNSPATGLIVVDADLAENELRCSVDPDKLVADGDSTANITCTAFGTGAAPSIGVRVNCDLNGPASLVPDEDVTDSAGQAHFTVTAGVSAGNAEIACEAPGVGPDAMDTVDVDLITVNRLEVLDLELDLMGVRGSGVNETAEVCFQVIDNNNQPFAEGLTVQFDGVGSTSDGVEIQNTQDTTDENGEVCTRVQSGSTFGTANINATVQIVGNRITETVQIPVRGVIPSRGGMTLTCAQRNIGALRYQAGDTIEEPPSGALCTTCELRLRDAADNLVGFEQIVTFRAESGTFRPTGQTTNDLNGLASVTWCADGNPPRDVDPFPDEPRWNEVGGGVRNPRDGLVTIVAYVAGDEELDDINGNGQFDPLDGEDFWDLPEPFVDVDDNNLFDLGLDSHVDVDGGTQNVWDGPDFAWSTNTVIWVQTRILLTSSPYFDRESELETVAAGWPSEERLPFDRDYPDFARLSHWYVLNTTDGFDQAENVYYPENPSDPVCNGTEPHCYIPDQAWFDGTVGLLVHYVLRDRNGNSVNRSLGQVSFDFHLTACGTPTTGAIRVESVGFDPGLATDSPFPFRFQIFREGGAEMDYRVAISDYVVGAVQTFSLTKGTTAIPPGGCRFQMIAPMTACPTCGDPADTGPWEFFVINDLD